MRLSFLDLSCNEDGDWTAPSSEDILIKINEIIEVINGMVDPNV